MSIAEVKNQISLFLKSSEPEVLAIRGKWGIGKTHYWNDEIVSASIADNGMAYERYAYVSLFGVNNLADLKLVIFENSLKKSDIEAGVSGTTLYDNLAELLNNNKKPINFSISDLARRDTYSVLWKKIREYQYSVKGIAYIISIPIRRLWGKITGVYRSFREVSYFKVLAPVIDAATFASVRNTIICMDDFERKGESLKTSEIMGLISILKEQKNCKIVMIFNEQRLKKNAPNEFSEFSEYREKVVDVDLEFNPRIEEILEIAFKNKKNDKYNAHLKNSLKKLDVKNIRVIDKTARMASILVSHIDGFSEHLVRRCIKSIAIQSAAYYGEENDKIPSLEFIENMTRSYSSHISRMLAADKTEDEETKMKRKWENFLYDYGYEYTDELNRQLIIGVKNGYFDVPELIKECKKVNDRIDIDLACHLFQNAWSYVTDSFDDNTKEVVERITTGIEENIQYILLSDLNKSVVLFRQIGAGDKADKLIDLYIDEHKSTKEKFDISGTAREAIDPALLSRVSEIYESFKVTMELTEAIEVISQGEGYSNIHIETLIAATEDDYYKAFKEKSGSNLLYWVKEILHFNTFNDEKKSIGEKGLAAAKIIGAENNLNKYRVGLHGIKLEEKNH